jgi:hypothetical protein
MRVTLAVDNLNNGGAQTPSVRTETDFGQEQHKTRGSITEGKISIRFIKPVTDGTESMEISMYGRTDFVRPYISKKNITDKTNE